MSQRDEFVEVALKEVGTIHKSQLLTLVRIVCNVVRKPGGSQDP
jgi:hypothetical protein